jgi:hypothetical protein
MNFEPLVKQGQTLVFKKDAGVEDTVGLIVKTINHYCNSPYVAELAKRLHYTPGNELDFLKRLFKNACTHVDYKMDPPGDERITTPERLLNDGVGDCKKFSVLISCVLKAVGIPSYLKVISYDGDSYEHIYVIVPTSGGYITLDPVNNCNFNKEFQYKKATVLDLNGNIMNLSLLGKGMGSGANQTNDFLTYLNGPVSTFDNDINALTGGETLSTTQEQDIIKNIMTNYYYLSSKNSNPWQLLPTKYNLNPVNVSQQTAVGMGDFLDFKWLTDPIQDGIDWIKNTAQKIYDGAVNNIAKVGLSPFRAAFLSLLAVNAFGLADKFAAIWNSRKGETVAWWQNLGGDANILRTNIARGANSNVIAGKEMGAPWVAAAITGAIPIVISALALLKKMGVYDPAKDTKDAELSKAVAAGATEIAKTYAANPNTPNIVIPTPTPTESDHTALYVGLGLAGLFFLTRK